MKKRVKGRRNTERREKNMGVGTEQRGRRGEEEGEYEGRAEAKKRKATEKKRMK